MHGRDRVVTFVGDALKRRGVPKKPLPVVLLAGPLGSGGTMLLDELWQKFSGKCLAVRLDLADAQGIEDIVLAATQGWRRSVPGIREIDFPRLRMIFKALSYVDNGRGREGFEAYLRAGPRDAAVSSALRDWADRAAPMLPPEQQLLVPAVAQLLGALHSAAGRRGDKKTLRWLAEYGALGGTSGYDRLWELRRQHHERTDTAVRTVGKALCAALLADTRYDFNDALQPLGRRRRNCLLLVDNADSAMGDLFLELLAESRGQSHAAGAEADPVLVVAVQHRRVRAGRTVRPLASTDERLVFDPEPGPRPAWWLPVRLTDLDVADVVEMCRSSVLRREYRDADFLHELTGGHPESADRLARLLEIFGPASYDPRALLGERLPPRHDLPDHWTPDDGLLTTVEDYLIKRTFPEDLAVLPDGRLDTDGNPMLDAMAVLAATPGMRRGACTAVFQFLRWSHADADTTQLRLTSALWLEETPDGEAARLHPLTALLLRRWLARRPGTWRDAHQGYAAHYSRPEDAALRHHHTLALVDTSRREPMATVIGHLERELDRAASTEDWLPILDQVTDAPNQVRTTGDPRSFVTTLAGVADSRNRHQAVTRLTIARWLHHDRSFDPAHRLAQTIANEYERLAEYTDDNEVLFRQAGKYRRTENEWKD